KDESEGHGDELDQQQGQNELDTAKPQLGPINGRDADNGANAVVIDEKGNQVLEQLAIAANVGHGSSQPSEADAEHALAESQGRGRRSRLGHNAKEGNRKHGPPDGHAQEREAGSPGTGQQLDHGYIDGQQQP